MKMLNRTSEDESASRTTSSATLTHGLPGILVGAGVVLAAVANHLLRQIWNQMPQLMGIGLIAIGVVWLVSVMERKTRDRNTGNGDMTPLDASGLLACALTTVGIVWFAAAWSEAHPGPERYSCETHGGIRGTVMYTKGDGQEYHTDQSIAHVVCNDGFVFSNPE